MERIKYWLFLTRWIPAVTIALLFTGFFLLLARLFRKLNLNKTWGKS